MGNISRVKSRGSDYVCLQCRVLCCIEYTHGLHRFARRLGGHMRDLLFVGFILIYSGLTAILILHFLGDIDINKWGKNLVRTLLEKDGDIKKAGEGE